MVTVGTGELSLPDAGACRDSEASEAGRAEMQVATLVLNVLLLNVSFLAVSLIY